jgi:hypothetical protein
VPIDLGGYVNGAYVNVEPTPPSTTDHLQTALEAGCDALITLQALSSRVSLVAGSGGVLDAVRAGVQLTHAIDALRASIGELRLARDNELSGLGLGFVLAEHQEPAKQAAPEDYTRPRRTA